MHAWIFVCLLGLSSLFLFVYSPEFPIYCLENGVAHSGLGLSTPINNQDSSSDTCLKGTIS